jgi:hypothetical protein
MTPKFFSGVKISRGKMVKIINKEEFDINKTEI